MDTLSPQAGYWQRHLANVLVGHTASPEPERRHPALERIQEFIRFRLAGWEPDGQRMTSEEEVRADIEHGVQSVEKSLVVDPMKVKEEFALLSAMLKQTGRDVKDLLPVLDPKKFSFIREGKHVDLASIEKLLFAWRDGFIVLAELELPDGTIVPLGYCHGLDSTPIDGPEFPNLNADTIVPAAKRRSAEEHSLETATIWRTGVRERIDAATLRALGIELEETSLSLRRSGLGSALKHIVIQQAALRGKTRAMLNVGTLKPPRGKGELEMPNDASMAYNENFLRRWHADREYKNPVVIPKRLGLREHVADMHWQVFVGDTDIALNRLEEAGGVLERKGWLEDLNRLSGVAEQIAEQLDGEPPIDPA